MAWDKDKPADSDLISDSAGDLRANFDAIETGDSSFLVDKFNLQEQAGDPSAITGASAALKAFRLYAKTDADSGQTEFFGIDDGGNVIQFSEGGLLGARDQQVIAQDITIGSNSFVNNQNNYVWAYGVVPAAAGAVSGGQGLGTATLGAVGSDSNVYTVPFSGRTPSNANYHVFLFPFSVRPGQANNRIANVITNSKTTSQFRFRVQRNGSSTNVADVPIQVMVVGGF